MPTFRTRQPSSLASGVRSFAASFGGAGGLNELEKMQIERAGARANREDSLAEKVRLEIEQMRAGEQARADPAAETDYAATVSGVRGGDTASNLSKFIRGLSEQFAGEGADEAGNVVPPIELPVARPDAVTPEQERAFRAARGSVMATRMATGRTNADQLTEAGGNLLTQALRNEITAPGTEVVRGNQLAQAAGLRAREPFATNAQGTVLNQETGDLGEGSLLAGAVRSATRALTGQRNAAGELSNTRANVVQNPVPRPAPNRTPGQEARDEAYARAQAARAAGTEAENLRTQQSRARSNFRTEQRTDPRLKGATLGKWVAGQGYEVKDAGGRVVGYYD
jgi:hypothetical protein